MASQIEALLDDAEIKSFLSGLSKRIKALTKGDKKYISLLSAITYRDVMDHFDKQSGPTGGWKKWSDVYDEHMKKIGKGGNRILQDTGRLRQSFTPSNLRTQSDGILWYNAAQTAKGFPYAAAHNEGGPKLPQREFMYLSDNALEDMTDKTLAFILDEGL